MTLADRVAGPDAHSIPPRRSCISLPSLRLSSCSTTTGSSLSTNGPSSSPAAPVFTSAQESVDSNQTNPRQVPRPGPTRRRGEPWRRGADGERDRARTCSSTMLAVKSLLDGRASSGVDTKVIDNDSGLTDCDAQSRGPPKGTRRAREKV